MNTERDKLLEDKKVLEAELVRMRKIIYDMCEHPCIRTGQFDAGCRCMNIAMGCYR